MDEVCEKLQDREREVPGHGAVCEYLQDHGDGGGRRAGEGKLECWLEWRRDEGLMAGREVSAIDWAGKKP